MVTPAGDDFDEGTLVVEQHLAICDRRGYQRRRVPAVLGAAALRAVVGDTDAQPGAAGAPAAEAVHGQRRSSAEGARRDRRGGGRAAPARPGEPDEPLPRADLAAG